MRYAEISEHLSESLAIDHVDDDERHLQGPDCWCDEATKRLRRQLRQPMQLVFDDEQALVFLDVEHARREMKDLAADLPDLLEQLNRQDLELQVDLLSCLREDRFQSKLVILELLLQNDILILGLRIRIDQTRRLREDKVVVDLRLLHFALQLLRPLLDLIQAQVLREADALRHVLQAPFEVIKLVRDEGSIIQGANAEQVAVLSEVLRLLLQFLQEDSQELIVNMISEPRRVLSNVNDQLRHHEPSLGTCDAAFSEHLITLILQALAGVLEGCANILSQLQRALLPLLLIVLGVRVFELQQFLYLLDVVKAIYELDLCLAFSLLLLIAAVLQQLLAFVEYDVQLLRREILLELQLERRLHQFDLGKCDAELVAVVADQFDFLDRLLGELDSLKHQVDGRDVDADFAEVVDEVLVRSAGVADEPAVLVEDLLEVLLVEPKMLHSPGNMIVFCTKEMVADGLPLCKSEVVFLTGWL